MPPVRDGHTINVVPAGLLALALLMGACSRDRDEVPHVDVTPPAKVTDLAARALSDSTILLTWTAPGDDGMDGTAARYDFRYNSEPFPDQGHFPASYPVVPGTPGPAPGGTPESLFVGGLTYSTTYHFGMRVLDEMENLSPLSNVASARTSDTLVVIPPDTTPPAMIADLAVERLDLRFFRFTWTAVGDDGMDGQAVSYDMRWSLEPLTDENWGMATPLDDLPNPRLPGRSETFEAVFPTGTEDRHVALRAVDDEGNRSPLHEPLLLPGLTPRTWYVNIEGTGDAPTIQAALDMAGPGDEVLVGPGLYRINLVAPTWSVQIKSTHGRDQTIIEPADETRSMLYMEGDDLSSWTVDGFTFRNGRATAGAAVYIRHLGRPSIRNCRFTGNRGFSGAAIHIATYLPAAQREDIYIEANEFIENEGDGNGGAIYLVVPVNEPMRYWIRDNLFLRNRCRLDGGAVFAGGGRQGRAHFLSNVFVDNHAGDHGGAILLGTLGSTGRIAFNLFVRNSADGARPGNTGSGGAININQTSGTIEHNTFYDNEGWTETGDGGGSIVVAHTRAQNGSFDLSISHNIFANSRGGVIASYLSDSLVRLGPNLIWGTHGAELVGLGVSIPESWQVPQLRDDPQFCDPAKDNFRVSTTSPAFEGKEVMGAFKEPGCP